MLAGQRNCQKYGQTRKSCIALHSPGVGVVVRLESRLLLKRKRRPQNKGSQRRGLGAFEIVK